VSDFNAEMHQNRLLCSPRPQLE